jgi:hypothetical protein
LLRLGLGLHLLGDAEALERCGQLGPGRALRNLGDGFRRQQRVLERFERADVGLGRAGAHTDAKADAGNLGARTGDDLALLARIIKQRRGTMTISNPSPLSICRFIVPVTPYWTTSL